MSGKIALRTLKKFLTGGVALLIILGAVQYVFNAESRTHYNYLRGEVERMSDLNTSLTQENEQLRLQISGIQKDDRYLEQIARQEFGMIREGEMLYKFTATP